MSLKAVIPIPDGGNLVVDSLTINGVDDAALATDPQGHVYGVTGDPGDVMRLSGTGASNLYSVATNGSIFVALGDQIYTSTTGTSNWIVRTNPSSNILLDVSWNGSYFVAVGVTGSIVTSSNGINWTLQTSGTTNNLAAVTWDATNSQWIAVGSTEAVLTSPNGIAWTTRTYGSTNAIRGVAAGTSIIVAVGVSGVINTSTDGVTWTPRTSGTANDLYNVIWDSTNSRFVAVGGNGTILTSTNGTSWTTRTSPTTNFIRNVFWNGSLYTAVCDGGVVITSSDSVTWASTATLGGDLYSVTYGSSLWITVGLGGLRYTSPDAVTWTIVNSLVWFASTPSGTGPLLARDGDKTINGVNTFPTAPKLTSILSSTGLRTSSTGVVEAATANPVTFTGTLTGVSGTVTNSLQYQLLSNGRISLIMVSPVSGTSNSNMMSITGLPVAARPSVDRFLVSAYFQDNNVASGPCGLLVKTTGEIVIYALTPFLSNSLFTASGTKGVGEFDITYTL